MECYTIQKTVTDSKRNEMIYEYNRLLFANENEVPTAYSKDIGWNELDFLINDCPPIKGYINGTPGKYCFQYMSYSGLLIDKVIKYKEGKHNLPLKYNVKIEKYTPSYLQIATYADSDWKNTTQYLKERGYLE